MNCFINLFLAFVASLCLCAFGFFLGGSALAWWVYGGLSCIEWQRAGWALLGYAAAFYLLFRCAVHYTEAKIFARLNRVTNIICHGAHHSDF